MHDNENILGCFVSANIGDAMGPEFRSYIYGKRANHQIDSLLVLLMRTVFEPLSFAAYISPLNIT